MLKISPRYRLQVPHGVAVVGALLLLASTVTGVGSALDAPGPDRVASASLVAGGDVESADSSNDSAQTVPQPPVKQKKRFRVNLFLFRR